MNTEAAGRRVHVIQGEFKVVNDPDIVLSTILGSCVAACMRDPAAGVGGMNHFLLPGSATSPSSGADATRYGVHLMELLINGLLKQGGAPRPAGGENLRRRQDDCAFLERRRAECRLRTPVPDGRGYPNRRRKHRRRPRAQARILAVVRARAPICPDRRRGTAGASDGPEARRAEAGRKPHRILLIIPAEAM